MLGGEKIVVVLPAYNAAKTLERTYVEIPMDIVDEVVLVDDCSKDNTVELAQKLGIRHIVQHEKNKGYGGNQKTCYKKALELQADIIIMLHPDYQYTPALIEPMASLLAHKNCQIVLGSRILGKGALKGGMPLHKYLTNRVLTFIQNISFSHKLSEYHTGYRAYTKEVLNSIAFDKNSDDFLFDNQFLAQAIFKNFDIGEITCPTKYFKEASSINLRRSSIYAIGCLSVSFRYLLHRWGLRKYEILEP